MSYWVCRNGHVNDSLLSEEVCTFEMQLGKMGCGAVWEASATYEPRTTRSSDPGSSTKGETREQSTRGRLGGSLY